MSHLWSEAKKRTGTHFVEDSVQALLSSDSGVEGVLLSNQKRLLSPACDPSNGRICRTL